MQRIAITSVIVGLAVYLTTAYAEDAQQPQPRRADASKVLVIESPTKDLLLAATKKLEAPAPAEGTLRETKIDVESPTKGLITAAAESTNKSAEQSQELSPSSATFKNPKVAPGKVRWHEDLATARAASKVSGKPVLLFQLMGNLDDRFC